MIRADKWGSVANEYVMCPYPDCGHTGNIITKAHCRMAHKMSREEIEKAYGMPYRLITKEGEWRWTNTQR